MAIMSKSEEKRIKIMKKLSEEKRITGNTGSSNVDQHFLHNTNTESSSSYSSSSSHSSCSCDHGGCCCGGCD